VRSSGFGLVAGCREHDNEPSYYRKGEQVHAELSDY
jgi:hypothetical protein